MKSRQKNWRESRSRETEVGEKIAVTNTNYLGAHKVLIESCGYNEHGKKPVNMLHVNVKTSR